VTASASFASTTSHQLLRPRLSPVLHVRLLRMKYTVYDRLLQREVGHQRRTYTDIRGIYGDRQWVEDLDIVNELEGHNGCVNALRYAMTL
jgi:hypothetical protein